MARQGRHPHDVATRMLAPRQPQHHYRHDERIVGAEHRLDGDKQRDSQQIRPSDIHSEGYDPTL